MKYTMDLNFFWKDVTTRMLCLLCVFSLAAADDDIQFCEVKLSLVPVDDRTGKTMFFCHQSNPKFYVVCKFSPARYAFTYFVEDQKTEHCPDGLLFSQNIQACVPPTYADCTGSRNFFTASHRICAEFRETLVSTSERQKTYLICHDVTKWQFVYCPPIASLASTHNCTGDSFFCQNQERCIQQESVSDCPRPQTLLDAAKMVQDRGDRICSCPANIVEESENATDPVIQRNRVGPIVPDPISDNTPDGSLEVLLPNDTSNLDRVGNLTEAGNLTSNGPIPDVGGIVSGLIRIVNAFLPKDPASTDGPLTLAPAPVPALASTQPAEPSTAESTTVTTPSPPSIPSSTYPPTTACINNYEFFSTKLTWANALSLCTGQGGTLAKVNSDEVTETLTELSKKRSWIGGSDQDEEGQWKWTDGTAIVYSRWARNEPNGGSSQNCVQMNYGGRGNWDDAGCDGQKPFFCQSCP